MLEIRCSLWLGLAFECHLLLKCSFWSYPFNYDEILLLGVGGFQFSLQSKTRSWFPFFGKTALRSKSCPALGQWGLTMLLAFHNESNRGTVKIALVFKLSRLEWSGSFFSQVEQHWLSVKRLQFGGCGDLTSYSAYYPYLAFAVYTKTAVLIVVITACSVIHIPEWKLGKLADAHLSYAI